MSDLDLQSRPALAPRVRLQIDAVSGDPVLLYPEGILILNPTAHEIVGRCQGELDVEEIVRRLQEEYDGSGEELRRDVLEILTNLKQRNLMIFSS
jgi:pyrroloquinoline quinone biosynthesis protein D